MNPMDCKQAQNVWSRVMAAQTAAPCTNAEKAPEKTARTQQAPAVSITPEQVMQAMHEELCDAETYRCLAARMSGCARKTLLAISHDERCHAKKLGAIYFLLTGKKACQKSRKTPASPATPRRFAGSISASFPRASTMKPLPPCPARGLARCANLRSTSAATRRASTSCCKAVSETETRRLPRW